MQVLLHLLVEQDLPTVEDILRQAPLPLVITDFSPFEVETWSLRRWGWKHPKLPIYCVDHHGQHPSFYRRISSGIQAAMFIEEVGFIENVAANHLDCDSDIAVAILRGDIKPSKALFEAVIAADHTGAQNTIADILQAFQRERNYEKALAFIKECLAGKLSTEAERLRGISRRRRQDVLDVRDAHQFTVHGNVVAIESQKNLVGTYLLPAFPDAALIISGFRRPDGLWNSAYRLGKVPEGKTIFDIFPLEGSAFGGRWNAGGSERCGGAVKSPGVLAAIAARKIAGW